MGHLVGLLLAAGAGERYGQPKALVETDGVPWVTSSARALSDGGCDTVVVVVGASARQVVRLLDPATVVVEAADWATGMGASLRAGLTVIEALPGDAALVHLVDLPDVGADVVSRVAARATTDVLARAVYRDGPGHPVLVGRRHWHGMVASTAEDRGGRDYLARRDVTLVDCSDLASGRDVDRRGPMLGR